MMRAPTLGRRRDRSIVVSTRAAKVVYKSCSPSAPSLLILREEKLEKLEKLEEIFEEVLEEILEEIREEIQVEHTVTFATSTLTFATSGIK